MNGITKLNEYVSMLTFPFGEMRSHLYLIHDQDEAALIDAHVASMSEEVLERIQEVISLDQLKTVILTHGHMDHVGVASHLQEKTEASIAIHIADAQYIEEPWTAFLTLYETLGITKQNYEEFQSMTGDKPVTVTQPLHHGDIVKVGSVELQIHHTPGHSPGSICIHAWDNLSSYLLHLDMEGTFWGAKSYKSHCPDLENGIVFEIERIED